MKRMFFSMLTLMILSAASMNGQVTIGNDATPTPGSILDLQSAGTLGLLLPQVTLTSADTWAPIAGTAVEGMAVYHNTDVLTAGLSGKGIYVWSNNRWRKQAPPVKCDGVIVYKAAWDYDGNVPGDSARVGGVLDNSTNQTWSPILTPAGAWSAGDARRDLGFSNVNADLCVYKRNDVTPDGGSASLNWMDAVNACANLVSDDGATDWYLPNVRELIALYVAIGGNGGGAWSWNNLQDRGEICVQSIPLPGNTWSSTQSNTGHAQIIAWGDGATSSALKSNHWNIRCVRRLL